MAQNQQQEFVNELLNKDDQVTGIQLMLNKYLILFLKCLYIRKQKKIITFFEFFLPLLIFYFAMNNQDKLFHFKDWKSPAANKSELDNFSSVPGGAVHKLQTPLTPLKNAFYYHYNQLNVNGSNLKQLEPFLSDALQTKLILKPLENITGTDYTAFYFKEFNLKSLDYQIVVADGLGIRRYSDWKDPQYNDYYGPIRRYDVEQYHEKILKKFATRLNPEAPKYKLDIMKLELPHQRPDTDELDLLYNPAVFQALVISLYCAYFINGIFVLIAVCEEKKTKSFDFLKLMGASDGQIFTGHFFNHILLWSFSFLICMAIFIFFLYGVLPFRAFCVLLPFAFLYLVHTIVFLFLLSAPFKRYLYPEILNVLLFFFCFQSYQLDTYQTGFVAFLKLAHPLNMLIRFQKIGAKVLCKKFTFENENIFKIFFYSDKGEMSITALFWSDLLFIVIEIFLINYIIQVNPFQTGVRKPFFYFLTRQYWVETPPITEYKQCEQKEFEKVPSSSRPTIILNSVDKWFRSWFIFGKFQVLKSFDFAIYERQITVLLGHNGAGKSTTMDLIAGLSTADRGSITVNGIPVNGYTSGFKQELGYCPQENVFYERLTVFENLKIASVLKGISFGASTRKIHALASKFDLLSKMGECSKNLSGGMKRRLCLGMAIIGYKEVLVIDEPTSGLDPETRRKIWEILLELRKSRTILLTTHFLEEADILGDSIAIMYDGQVRCCGSTLFLKKLYHVGYLLRVQLSGELTEANQLLEMIKQYIPDAFLETQRANELFFRLTLSEEQEDNRAGDNQAGDNKADDNLNLMIARLLDEFENIEIKSKYRIETFGLTNTTLEDVFIKIGTLDAPKEKAITIETVEDHPLHNLQRLGGFSLYLQQLWAIQCKKLKLSYKNLSLFWQSIYLVLPILLLAIALTPTIQNLIKSDEFTYDTFSLEKLKNKEVWAVKNAGVGSAESDLFRKANLDWLNNKYGLTVVEVKEKTAKDAVEQQTSEYGIKKLRDILAFVPERLDEFGYRLTVNSLKVPYSTMGSLEMFYRLVAMQANRDSDFKVNLKFQYLKPSGAETNSFLIDVGNVFKFVRFKLFAGLACTFPIALMFSFPFIAFVELPHEEMNSGALSMQIIAGLSKILYWIGNLLFDFLYSFVVVGIACLSIYFFTADIVLSPHLPALLLAFTLALFNCLLITYFIVNLNFSKEVTDTLVKWPLFGVGLAIGIYDAIATFVHFPLKELIIWDPDPNKPPPVIDMSKFNVPGHVFFLLVSPVYNVMDTFNQVLNKKLFELCNQEFNTDKCELVYLQDYNFAINLAAYLVSMSIFGGLIFLVNRQSNFILRAADHLKVRFQKTTHQEMLLVEPRRTSRTNANYLTDLKDPKVDEEAQLAQLLIETNSMQSNILVVHDLYKLYGSLEAVNHLSFTVKRGECFGLLGINGAGKTTTFKMIGGAVMPTAGNIVLDGYTFDCNPYEYYRRLSYCPQENTHTKRITVSDNLVYYARINGVPGHLLSKTVHTLIDECDLQEHCNKFADKLSGGNMRKLSTAISLIGKKDLILLDEMSTGVDPLARRKLWKTIDFYKQELKCSFILTSHSMDEVENLCSTISIMSAGQFKCLGTFNYLRDKYSQGFTILIKIKEIRNDEAYLERLKEQMEADFNGKATLKEFYMNTVVYIIMSKVFKWPRLFRAMEKIKDDLDLEDFLVSDTNLEQIFLSFAQQD